MSIKQYVDALEAVKAEKPDKQAYMARAKERCLLELQHREAGPRRDTEYSYCMEWEHMAWLALGARNMQQLTFWPSNLKYGDDYE